MQSFATMMASVKDLISSIDLAKRLDVAADIARSVGNSAAHLAKRGGSQAAGLARRGSGSAVVLAKKVGPRRALIGLAVVGVAIGGIVLVRYLRANREEGDEDLEATEEPQTAAGRRARKEARALRKASQAAVTH
jgi:hypothetical protein